ncbi:MAG: PEP-CTERM sorting domain-containing protein [Phycisphaerae bacterium]
MFNKSLVLTAAVASLAFGLASAHANILVNESFTHPDGNLVGQTPETGAAWAAHSGAGSTPVQVASGTAVLNQGSGSREDVNAGFDGGYTLGAGGKLYAAFDVTITDPGAAITSGYFAHFLQGSSNFASRVWVTAPTTSGYRIALSNGGSLSPASGSAGFSSDLAFGTTYRVVTSYDFDAMQGALWINPVTESSTSATATDPGFADPVTSYAFRQAAGNTVETIDNLTVATTFQEALTGHAVPEPASLGVLAIGGLALLSRRRK